MTQSDTILYPKKEQNSIHGWRNFYRCWVHLKEMTENKKEMCIFIISKKKEKFAFKVQTLTERCSNRLIHILITQMFRHCTGASHTLLIRSVELVQTLCRVMCQYPSIFQKHTLFDPAISPRIYSLHILTMWNDWSKGICLAALFAEDWKQSSKSISEGLYIKSYIYKYK